MNEQTQMNAAEAKLAEKSPKDLAAAILNQAKQELRRFRGAMGTIERDLRGAGRRSPHSEYNVFIPTYN